MLFWSTFIKLQRTSGIRLEPVVYLGENAGPDVEVLVPDVEVPDPGCVKSGPEMLPEKFGTVLEKNKTNSWSYRQNCSLSEVLNFWWNPSLTTS